MKHSFSQIIDNQKEFRNEILSWLKNDYARCKKVLKEINEDEYVIKKEKDSLIKKFESINIDKFILSLFFKNSKRSKKFYAWWEKENEEVIIYQYGSQRERNR